MGGEFRPPSRVAGGAGSVAFDGVEDSVARGAPGKEGGGGMGGGLSKAEVDATTAGGSSVGVGSALADLLG